MAAPALTPPDPALADPRSDDEVLLWRYEQFRHLGFGESDAIQLADSRADLGQARYVLASGCPPKLALQILL
jgi:hypothetical protein